MLIFLKIDWIVVFSDGLLSFFRFPTDFVIFNICILTLFALSILLSILFQYYGFARHHENLLDRHTEKKLRFVVFGPTNHLTRRHDIQKVRKWRLTVKILRENMRDMLFLDVFNQTNYKYTPTKDFHLSNCLVDLEKNLSFSYTTASRNFLHKIWTEWHYLHIFRYNMTLWCHVKWLRGFVY